LLDLEALGLPTPPALILRAEATTRRNNLKHIITRVLQFFSAGEGLGRTVSLRCAAKARAGGVRLLPESVLSLGIQSAATDANASRAVCAAHAKAFFCFFGMEAAPDFSDLPLSDQLRALLTPLLAHLSGANTLLASGTPRALIVQRMVYGDLDARSLTGMCYTRHPYTGEILDYGHFLTSRQGMALGGVDDPAQRDLPAMAAINPLAYAELKDACLTLEAHYAAVRQLEFTAEGERLYLLQNTAGNSTLRLES
jgi:hypothetical protein